MTTQIQIPPQDMPAEICTLASMILDEKQVPAVRLKVSETDFYQAAHQQIFSAIIETYENTLGNVDLVLLVDTLTKSQQIKEIGGVEYLTEIVDSVPGASNAEYYAKIVKEKSLLRQVIRTCVKFEGQAYEQQHGDIEIFMSEFESDMFNISQRNNSKSGMETIKALVGEVMANIAEGVSGGIETGYRQFDELTGGLLPGQMIVVAGRPSMGKSSWAFNVAVRLSEQGKGTLMFSPEMAGHELAKRYLSLKTGVPMQKIQAGNVSGEDTAELKRHHAELIDLPIYIYDQSYLSATEILSAVRYEKSRNNIDLVIIDYLQLLDDPKAKSTIERITNISRQLKCAARATDLPFMVVSQLNRKADDRDDHRPRLSDLRESGAIEQDADIVCLIYRDDYYNKKDHPDNKVELRIAKNRSGPCGMADLLWFPESMKIETLAKDF